MARRRIELSDQAKELLGHGLKRAREQTAMLRAYADDSFAIEVYEAFLRGMTIREIADWLGIGRDAAQKLKDQGEQARDRRLGGDPDRPGELAANG